MKSKTRQRIVVVTGLVVVVAVLVGVKANQIVTMVRAGESFVPPPQAVTSAKVQDARWEVTRGAVGTLVASQGVTIAAEVAGRVIQISYESGATVKRGDVLVRLDATTDQAQLAAAVADAQLAEINLERSRRLRQSETIAQVELDTAEARAKQTAAVVANLRAVISKKTVRAPFDGRIAIRQVNLGQIISPGTAIASLQAVTPIYADFWLPQQALRDVVTGESVQLRTDTFPDAAWRGAVTTINPEVDPGTRNVRIRATFPNQDGRLRPGMFGNVEVISSETRRVLTIPATAVLYAPYGDSVFAIEEQKDPSGKAAPVARQKFVRLGERRGDLVEVVSGLQPGDTVVGSGGFRLRNGTTVAVNDALAPKAQLTPKPTDQ